MKYSKNYNLNKPEQEDYYNVEDFNKNADIVDAVLKEHAQKLTGNAICYEQMVKHNVEASFGMTDFHLTFRLDYDIPITALYDVYGSVRFKDSIAKEEGIWLPIGTTFFKSASNFLNVLCAGDQNGLVVTISGYGIYDTLQGLLDTMTMPSKIDMVDIWINVGTKMDSEHL